MVSSIKHDINSPQEETVKEMAEEQHQYDIVWKNRAIHNRRKGEHVAVMSRIPGSSSTVYFRFCEQERLNGYAARIRRLDKYAPPVLPVVQQGNMGRTIVLSISNNL